MTDPVLAEYEATWEAAGRRVAPELGGAAAVLVLGQDAIAAAAVALGIGRAESAQRRVAIGDLVGDVHPLHSLVTEEDVPGITDVFLYGVSISRIAFQIDDEGNLFVLPSGCDPSISPELLRHERWRRLATAFREGDLLLLLVAPAHAAGTADLASMLDGVVVVADTAPPPGVRVLATARIGPAAGEVTHGSRTRIPSWDGVDHESVAAERYRDPAPHNGFEAPAPESEERAEPMREHAAARIAMTIATMQAAAADEHVGAGGETSSGAPTRADVDDDAPPDESLVIDSVPVVSPGRAGLNAWQLVLLLAAGVLVGALVAWLVRDRLFGRARAAAMPAPAPASPVSGRVVAPVDPPVEIDTGVVLVPANPRDSSHAAAYAVQLALVSTGPGADAELRKSGRSLPAGTFAPITSATGGPQSYRLTAGAYATASEAESLSVALRRSGLLPARGQVVRAPLALLLDSAPDGDRAAALMYAYIDRGIPAYALAQADGSVRIYTGAFETPAQAAIAAASLRSANIDATLVYRVGRVM